MHVRLRSAAAIVVTGAIALLLVACPSPLGEDPPDGDPSDGSIVVSIGTVGALAAAPDVGSAIADYQVDLNNSDAEPLSQISTATEVAFAEVAPGSWSVTVTARDAEAAAIAIGSASAEVVASEIAAVTIELTALQSGEGVLDLSVSWPAGLIDGVVSAALTPTDGTAQDIVSEFDAVENGAELTTAVASGTYNAQIELERNEVIVAMVSEAIVIVDNLVTTATFELSADEINQPPSAPASLSANEVSPGEVELTWTDQADNESGYRVERGAGENPSEYGELAGDLPAGSTSYTDDTAETNTLYTYRVTAFNAVGSSSATALIYTGDAPQAPASLVAGETVPGEVSLIWVDEADDESGYRVERGVGASPSEWSELVGDLPADSTEYADDTIEQDTQYTYRVSAFNEYGWNSATATLTTGAPPAAPTSLTAEETEAGVLLSWVDEAENEDGFDVERGEGASPSEWTLLGEGLAPDTTEFGDGTVSPSTLYTYRVTVYNDWGSDSATTSITTADSPFLHVATDGDDGSGDGSAGAPYATIGAALAVADSGDTIRVASADGGAIYQESSTLAWVDGVDLEGGWAPDFSEHDPGSYEAIVVENSSDMGVLLLFDDVAGAEVSDIGFSNDSALTTVRTISIVDSSPTFTNVTAEAASNRVANAVGVSGSSSPSFANSRLVGLDTLYTTGAYSRAMLIDGDGVVTLTNTDLLSDYTYITEPLRLLPSFTGSLVMTGGSVDMSNAGAVGGEYVYAARGVWLSGGDVAFDGVSFYGAGNIGGGSGEQLISIDMDDALQAHTITIVGGAFHQGYNESGSGAFNRSYGIDLEFGSRIGELIVRENELYFDSDPDTQVTAISLQGEANAITIDRNSVFITPAEGRSYSYGIYASLDIGEPGTDPYEITNNVIAQNGDGSMFLYGISIYDRPGLLIANNTIFSDNSDAQVYGISITEDSATPESPTPQLINNIITISGGGYGIYEGSVEDFDGDGTPDTNTSPSLFLNNYVDETGTANVYLDDGETSYSSAAELNNPDVTTEGEPSSTTGNVTEARVSVFFADPSSRDFHLTAENNAALLSGGLDAADSYGITVDRDGVVRTGNGSTGYSIGAYEED